MKEFTVYDPATGNICWSGTCADDQIEAQPPQGLRVLEGRYHPSTHIIKNNEPQQKPPEPPKPKTYQQRRLLEYPDISEQLDAIFKGGNDFIEMRNRIMDIKKRNPKP